MRVLSKKTIPPRKQEVDKREKAGQFTFPAPIRGWVLNESLSSPQPGGARILDNWICDLSTIRVRKGTQKHATLGDDVTSLFTYRSGLSEVFFGATATDVYRITSPADPDVVPAADISGQTSGEYASQMFSTPGGDFLYIANGSDGAQYFDGAAWNASGITGVPDDTLADVWSHGSRIWFVQGGTKSAWYLAPNSISGAATEFPLDGVFKRGGSLYLGAAWSLDAGDGMDDKCVFVSTEGEVAVYSGTDPSTNFVIEGRYDLARPLGRKTMQAGGDLLIMTELGIIPISEALRRDVASLSLGAVSLKIETYWQRQAKTLPLQWDIEKWPSENIMVVSQPEAVSSGGTALVANLHTGSWSRFTGLDTRCLGYFNDSVFFGSFGGAVYRMQVTAQDGTMPYTCTYVGQFEHMGSPGFHKSLKQLKPTLSSNTEINPLISALTDYNEVTSVAPPAAESTATEGWDVSTWDVSLWDAEAGAGFSPGDSLWRTVGVSGYAIAPEIQMTFGGGVTPDVELIDIHATYTMGALVT